MHTPSAPAVVRLHRAYPGRPDQVKKVRADLAALLDGCPAADDLILCASELATNAVRHSRSGLRGATFTLRAEIGLGSHARIEIQDRGGPWRNPAPGPGKHHGLDIIRNLATTWEIEGDHLGRTIWVRIDWPQP
jgi:anti-sigma regulatory factor (Ser/Thr protein kinase)